MRILSLTALAILILGLASPALAGWETDPYENNYICTYDLEQGWLEGMPDGSGGIVVVWVDYRLGPDDRRIYIQRLDANGDRAFAAQGIRVCTYESEQHSPQIVSDGAGGVIVVWCDVTAGETNLYAQRIGPSGALLWDPAGKAVCTVVGSQQSPHAVADGLGGVVVAWGDYRSVTVDVYAQRLNSSGVRQWTSTGVLVCDATGDEYVDGLVDDQTGGAIVVWVDHRDGQQVYAQRVNSVGSPIWTEDGVHLCSTTDVQYDALAASDASGGVFAFWYDGEYDNITGMHVTSGGTLDWPSLGMAASTGSETQYRPAVAPDGEGGVLVSWQQGGCNDIYVQRLSREGWRLWGSNGVQASPACQVYLSVRHSLAPDGSGGALLAWTDRRFGNDHLSVHGQRVGAGGDLRWDPDGVMISRPTCSIEKPEVVSDARGGLISAWTDSRVWEITELDIYAQRLDANGYWGVADPVMASIEDRPDDQGGSVIVGWTSAYVDADPYFAVENYTLWFRASSGARAASPLSPEQLVELREVCGLEPARIEALLRDSWTYVVTVPAIQTHDYSTLAPTFGDSTENGIAWMDYKVLAHGTRPGTIWESEPMAGYSVDNWAPGAPLYLVGEMDGEVVSLWWTASGHHDEDLDYYIIYRGTTSDFPLDEAHQVGSADDASYTEEPGPGTWHYRVTAIDVHNNESEGSGEVILSPSSTVEESLPTMLSFSRPHPNPAREQTAMTLALPKPQTVKVIVVDVSGARVAILAQGTQAAGVHRFVWDGRDDAGRPVASGIYLFQVEAEDWRKSSQVIWIR
ncbi:MAG: hypothetical protein KJ970_02460 [Candidatus Eisenbacteria bacterium]|uniref:FlgD/Vpr Ig-like domain-containing protein n=1 Tax=Eiseniibacteriota bacterium TaxID=2212470 RepID=A0A948RTL5_UNCEI|nr:hypothetical protein [Candidatus Eisenbacteria bacterium]MBU1949101.1 hypothetical protein [Candidatus Eisenbacteria bacterium]MBU2689761.1 hypothetical protein [Candidatus Eisenbacteria bacterium]